MSNKNRQNNSTINATFTEVDTNGNEVKNDNPAPETKPAEAKPEKKSVLRRIQEFPENHPTITKVTCTVVKAAAEAALIVGSVAVGVRKATQDTEYIRLDDNAVNLLTSSGATIEPLGITMSESGLAEGGVDVVDVQETETAE